MIGCPEDAGVVVMVVAAHAPLVRDHEGRRCAPPGHRDHRPTTENGASVPGATPADPRRPGNVVRHAVTPFAFSVGPGQESHIWRT